MTDTYLSAEKTVTASGRSPLGVAELISPTTIDTFFDEYWQRKPLVVHRDDPKYFAELLTLEDVDTILATTSLTDDGAAGDRGRGNAGIRTAAGQC